MKYQNIKLNENEENIRLDNAVVTSEQFNEALSNLKPNQRIIETDTHNYHTIERMFD